MEKGLKVQEKHFVKLIFRTEEDLKSILQEPGWGIRRTAGIGNQQFLAKVVSGAKEKAT